MALKNVPRVGELTGSWCMETDRRRGRRKSKRRKTKEKQKAILHKKFVEGCMNFMYFGAGRWMGPWTVARTIVVRGESLSTRHPAV